MTTTHNCLQSFGKIQFSPFDITTTTNIIWIKTLGQMRAQIAIQKFLAINSFILTPLTGSKKARRAPRISEKNLWVAELK